MQIQRQPRQNRQLGFELWAQHYNRISRDNPHSKIKLIGIVLYRFPPVSAQETHPSFGCFGVRSSRAGGWRPRVLQLEFFGGVAVALAGKQAKAGVGKFATLSNTAPTHARSATVAQLAGRYPSHQPSRARATISTASTTNHPRPQQSAHLASRHTSDSPRAPNDLAQLAQRSSPLPLPTHRHPTRAQQSASRHPTCLVVAQFACAHGSQPTD